MSTPSSSRTRPAGPRPAPPESRGRLGRRARRAYAYNEPTVPGQDPHPEVRCQAPDRPIAANTRSSARLGLPAPRLRECATLEIRGAVATWSRLPACTVGLHDERGPRYVPAAFRGGPCSRSAAREEGESARTARRTWTVFGQPAGELHSLLPSSAWIFTRPASSGGCATRPRKSQALAATSSFDPLRARAAPEASYARGLSARIVAHAARAKARVARAGLAATFPSAATRSPLSIRRRDAGRELVYARFAPMDKNKRQAGRLSAGIRARSSRWRLEGGDEARFLLGGLELWSESIAPAEGA